MFGVNLKTLCHFYSKDLSSDDDVIREYQNIHAFLDAWEFDRNETVPRDIEDQIFLRKHYQLANIACFLSSR